MAEEVVEILIEGCEEGRGTEGSKEAGVATMDCGTAVHEPLLPSPNDDEDNDDVEEEDGAGAAA